MWALLFAVAGLAAPRVLVVQSDDLEPYTEPVSAFLDALGEPATVVNLHGRRSDAEALVARARRDPPDVVFALGAKAAYTVRQGLPDTPIVYTAVMQPERYGIVGDDIAGIEMTVRPVHYLAQIKTFLPQVKKVGYLRGPTMRDADVDGLRWAATEAGLQLVVMPVSSPRQVRRAFDELAADVDALWLHPDRDFLTAESFRTLTAETRRRRMPLLVETDNMVRAGGLFAVMPDPDGIGTQAARLVKQLLEGAPPEEREQYPDQVMVAVNARTLELAEVPFDRLLLDFVDLVVE